MLPDGLGVEVDLGHWTLPPVFHWLAEVGAMEEAEMLRIFNAGIGMVLVVAADQADQVSADLQPGRREAVHRIGQVVPGQGVSYLGRLT